MRSHNLAVIDDTETLRASLRSFLEVEGYTVTEFDCAEKALEQCTSFKGDDGFDLIITDLKLPGIDGINFVEKARQNCVTAPIVVMTAYGTIESAISAMKKGANDFICKPFDPEKLTVMIKELLEYNRIVTKSKVDRNHEIITRSNKILELLTTAKKVAQYDVPVLILGESGVGKELFARYIHNNSKRKNHRFLSVNTCSIPSGLLESEFFGHSAGAFTGATQHRPGLMEIASDGTLFLDEIGDMDVSLQAKLLRALQEGEIRRIGSNQTIKVNPRIISATNRDLKIAMAEGRFREDLYYRLSVAIIEVPPLRHRLSDIPLLVEHFLDKIALENGIKKPSITKSALSVLMSYSWPGNIRELENCVERAVISSGKPLITEEDFYDLVSRISTNTHLSGEIPPLADAARLAARTAELKAIESALRKTKGNKSKAAKLLKVSYKTLLTKMKELGIQ